MMKQNEVAKQIGASFVAVGSISAISAQPIHNRAYYHSNHMPFAEPMMSMALGITCAKEADKVAAPNTNAHSERVLQCMETILVETRHKDFAHSPYHTFQTAGLAFALVGAFILLKNMKSAKTTEATGQ